MLQDEYELDGVVTVVDARNVLSHLDKEGSCEGHGVASEKDWTINEAASQVAFADRVLLNKVDAVEGDTEAERALRIKEVEAAIRKVNGAATIHHTTQSSVAIEDVLNIQGFDPDRAVALLDEAKKTDEHHHHHDHDDGHHHHDHIHTPSHTLKHGITTVCFESKVPMNPVGLSMYINQVTAMYGTKLYRYNGIISALGDDDKLVMQGVPNLRSGPYQLEPWGAAERSTKMVFIGKDLDADKMRDGFNRCVANPLRFPIGARVECAVAGGMAPGTVEAHWEQGYPYRVRLDAPTAQGYDEVWPPFDENEVVREEGVRAAGM
eukprot:TRINITY_DN3103_c0_g1_i23.p2 TRINITY_DN3103_c0_g1~~TRINITY_DN3103_c0_g1_i23.p2  ORF type:complete len:321 (+),score=106.84 TRINITY_DN3103_c0_g1_i23:534-1496(+)